MAYSSSLILVLILSAAFNTSFLMVVSAAAAAPSSPPPPFISNFYRCVNLTSKSQITFSQGFYDPNNDKASFTFILNSTAENLRCLAPSLEKPRAIFTPSNDAQVQAAVQCAVQNGLHIRIRSGGHDYEGLSYITLTCQPFVLIDLRKIRKVKINIKRNTAWVDSGNTIGELYYSISQKSKTHAFPAGIYTDLGVGGHFTGGAYGSLMRKYGLGADNVLDAEIVNHCGQILNRTTMGEDLFWAIRGGGGANFGIILRWKIRLVPIPKKVTIFSVSKLVSPRDKNNMGTLRKWQTAAPNIAKELFIRVIMVNAGSNNVTTIYQALYLGSTSDLLNVMNTSFPELGLVKSDCSEMTWIESVIANAGFPQGTQPKDLLERKGAFLNYFKSKSDYVVKPIPDVGLEKMLAIITEASERSLVIWTPYGGRMGEISENAIAFVHRNVQFKMQYVANWKNASAQAQLENEAWVRKLYNSMTDSVSNSPRQSYVNYRDLDIGKPDTGTNCSDPSIWGPKYYKGNYQKLVDVKKKVDPNNVFHNEQSIPLTANVSACIPFDVKKG